MADVLHNTLTAADLHEPKGASTATQGQVYVADGNGSGVWTSISFTTPPGMVAPFLTPVAPFGWLELNGSVLNTSTYSALYNAMTITLSGTRVSGQAVITALSNTNNLKVGYYAYGVGIASGTKILTIDSSSQVTLDANASSTGTADIAFSPWLLNLNTITLPNLTNNGYYLRSRSPNKEVGFFENDATRAHNHTASASTTISSAGNHNHSAGVTDPGHIHGFSGYNSAVSNRHSGIESGQLLIPLGGNPVARATTGISVSIANNGDHTHSASTSVSVSNSGGAETRPYSLSVMYCVKT